MPVRSGVTREVLGGLVAEEFHDVAALDQRHALGGDAWCAGVNFGTDVMRDQPDDALSVSRQQRRAGIGQTLGETINPEPAVGVQHHLDDSVIF
jgi:hypothetical protein